MQVLKKQLSTLKILWSVAFIILSFWYLYWIYYDVSVWNKTLAQVAVNNYAGLGISLFLAIFGTQINKVPTIKTLFLPTKQTELKSQLSKSQSIQQIKQTRTSLGTKQIMTVAPAQAISEQKSNRKEENHVPRGCNHSLGYLRERPKSEAIPAECITCAYVVGCLSPTKHESENAISVE